MLWPVRSAVPVGTVRGSVVWLDQEPLMCDHLKRSRELFLRFWSSTVSPNGDGLE